MPYTRIKETCLYIDDLDKALAFYQGLLEMPLISKAEGRHVFFRCGDSVLLCFLAETTQKETTLPSHYAHGKQHIAFEVKQDDYLATLELVTGKGINITHEQDWGSGRQSFYFEDPFGHVLEIVPEGIWE
ncbi:VOC family protein [Cyclobacterium jeungdonense]|uniref:VOC family protein n=1 Tax=Cyclobacterium jeungdonense TaxID=708087 RepID=A0ABT8CAU7_9BACT|nr:VOC family protein [Cyclobacterium jeungdonense]MDN3689933.1 VOC family protein [Cyclobacterium jeungdonense]